MLRLAVAQKELKNEGFQCRRKGNNYFDIVSDTGDIVLVVMELDNGDTFVKNTMGDFMQMKEPIIITFEESRIIAKMEKYSIYA